MSSLSIELVPVRQRPGVYAALLGQRVLARSRQPLLDAARGLLAEGMAPETVLVARHAGSSTIAMRSTVGEAAKWTIKERDRGGLRKELWQPHPKAGEPMEDRDQIGDCSIPEGPKNAREGEGSIFDPSGSVRPEVPAREVAAGVPAHGV